MPGSGRRRRTTTRRTALTAVGSLSFGSVLSGCQSLLDPPGTDEGFSIVVLPDTQHYSRLDNGLFERQTQWVVDNREAFGIAAVLHLGDLVADPGDPAQWAVATAAMSTLDDAGVPTLVALGNHDAADVRSPTTFRDRLPTERYERLEATTDAVVDHGTYDGNPENAYLRQRLGNVELLYLTLEFGPRKNVVEWADAVLADHADAAAVLTTHSYLYHDGTKVDRTDDNNPREYGLTDVHNGVELWDELVRHHGNVVNVHSGHHLPANTGLRVDEGDPGTPVSQMFVNYQTEVRGGAGWLRLLTVDLVRDRLAVDTYSPALDRWHRSGHGQFEVPLVPPQEPGAR